MLRICTTQFCQLRYETNLRSKTLGRSYRRPMPLWRFAAQSAAAYNQAIHTTVGGTLCDYQDHFKSGSEIGFSGKGRIKKRVKEGKVEKWGRKRREEGKKEESRATFLNVPTLLDLVIVLI